MAYRTRKKTFKTISNVLVVALVLTLLGVIVPGAGGTVAIYSLGAAADTYVDNVATTTNYGTLTPMRVRGPAAGSTRRALVSFDTSAIPAGAKVETATLSLNFSTVGTAGFIDSHRVTSSWTEGGSTWNSRDGVTSWTVSGGDFAATATASANVTAVGRFGFNVVNDVQSWVNGASINNGWILRARNEATATTYVRPDSKESPTPANRPQLNLAYIIGDSTVTPSSAMGSAPTAFRMRLSNTGGANGDQMNEATFTIPAGYTAISSASASATAFGKTWTVTTQPGATGPTTAKVTASSAANDLTNGQYVDVTLTATTPGSTGNTTWTAGIKGAAGGWYSDPTPTTVYVDATPPITTLSTSPTPADGDAGWFKTAPEITLNSNESGVTQYQWDSTAGAWNNYAGAGLLGQVQGTHTLYHRSIDGLGNTETPANSQEFKIDTGSPADPTSLSSSSHTTGTPSGDPNVVVDFSGATDTASGVEGYSASWSSGATATPDLTIDMAAGVNTTTSPALADGVWYFNLRTKDNAGNWTSTAHLGPFIIDTASPTGGSVSINNGDTDTSSTAVALSLDATDGAGSGVAQMRFAETTAALSAASYQSYNTTAAFGLSPGDGAKTIYVQYKDAAGNESAPVNDAIFLDTTAPGGTIAINGGAANTTSKAVNLSVSATDAVGSGVAEMSFSSDGAVWSPPEAYTTAKSRNLTGADGTKTVYAKFKDASGNWSAPVSDNVFLDTAAPSARMVAPSISTNVSKTKVFKVSWSGSDRLPGSGVASFDVYYKIGFGGAWKAFKIGTAAKSANFTGVSGKTYYFKSRARDRAGNIGVYSAVARTIVPYDQNRLIKKRVGFKGAIIKAGSGYFLGTARYSAKRGESIAYAGVGNYFALIADKGKNRGRAKIFVDGKLKKTINTYSASTKYRQVVYAISFAKARKHTLKIVNYGRGKRRRIIVDGLAIGN